MGTKQRRNKKIKQKLKQSELQKAVNESLIAHTPKNRSNGELFRISRGSVSTKEKYKNHITFADRILYQRNGVVPPKVKTGPSKYHTEKITKLADNFANLGQNEKKRKTMDLWAPQEEDPKWKQINEQLDLDEEWTAPAKKQKLKPPKASRTYQPSVLPAVEVPSDGLAYKPTEEGYDDLIGRAYAEELTRQRKQTALERRGRKERTRPGELSSHTGEDMFYHDHLAEQGQEIVESEPTPGEIELRQEEADRLRKQKLKEHKKARRSKKGADRAVIAALPTVVKKLEKELETRDVVKKALADRREEKSLNQPRRLGKQKYEKPELTTQIILKSRLPKHLRAMPQPVDLLSERFDSLQRRSIIEPREKRRPAKVATKKSKPKKYFNEWDG